MALETSAMAGVKKKRGGRSRNFRESQLTKFFKYREKLGFCHQSTKKIQVTKRIAETFNHLNMCKPSVY